jgi:hypothetical protein
VFPFTYRIQTTAGFNKQKSAERKVALKPTPFSWKINEGVSLPRKNRVAENQRDDRKSSE